MSEENRNQGLENEVNEDLKEVKTTEAQPPQGDEAPPRQVTMEEIMLRNQLVAFKLQAADVANSIATNRFKNENKWYKPFSRKSFVQIFKEEYEAILRNIIFA